MTNVMRVLLSANNDNNKLDVITLRLSETYLFPVEPI